MLIINPEKSVLQFEKRFVEKAVVRDIELDTEVIRRYFKVQFEQMTGFTVKSIYRTKAGKIVCSVDFGEGVNTDATDKLEGWLLHVTYTKFALTPGLQVILEGVNPAGQRRVLLLTDHDANKLYRMVLQEEGTKWASSTEEKAREIWNDLDEAFTGAFKKADDFLRNTEERFLKWFDRSK